MSVSASKSALLLSPCIRWAWDGAKPYEDEYADTTKRDQGTAFHTHMDRYYRGLPMQLSQWPAVDQWAVKSMNWSKQHLEPRCQAIHSEVYVGFNLSTSLHHVDPEVRDRKYPDMPGYIPGTTDLVCILSDGSLLVADWKTGGGTGADKQLLTLALGLRAEFLAPGGVARDVRISVLYAGENGVWPEERAVSEEELQQHKLSMLMQYEDIGVRTDAVPGIHCTQLYCPHLAHCPGIGTAVADVTEAAPVLLPAKKLRRKWDITSDPTSSEHAGSIMERVTAAERQLKYHKARIQKYLADGGRCISGGYEYSNGSGGHRWRTTKA